VRAFRLAEIGQQRLKSSPSIHSSTFIFFLHFHSFIALVALYISHFIYLFFTIPVQPTNQTYSNPNQPAKMQFTSILLFVASASALAIRQANSQSFTGALGGIAATPVLDSGDAKRPFSVKGDTFVNLNGALQRSCDQQFNACANQANGGNAAFTTQECSAQKSKYFLVDVGEGQLC
jgi:hypothetical protein